MILLFKSTLVHGKEQFNLNYKKSSNANFIMQQVHFYSLKKVLLVHGKE